MTSTSRFTAALRGALVAGLIGAAGIGMCGTAAAAPSVPAVTAGAFGGHHQVLVVGDYDDDGGGGGTDYAEQPAYEEPEAPAYEAPAEVPEAPADEAPAEEAPAEQPADDAAPDETPAEAPVEDPQPADEAPTDEPEAAPEAPEPAAPEEAPAPADQAPAPADQPAAPADLPAEPGGNGGSGEAAVTEAAPSDVTTAQHATILDANASTASTTTVDELRTEIQTEMSSTTSVSSQVWNREVTQWNTSWISYDEYYRPVLMNPFRTPLQLLYGYGNASRTVTVQPLSRVVLDVPAAGVYNFTGLRRTPTGALSAVSVGSFTGGGFVPAPGQPRPVKPVAPPTSKNVLVRVQYATGSSVPFRVKQLTDLGDDNAVHARRVLIDGTTSAWGQWTKIAGGEQEFDITKTLQLPGLAGPAQAPLPGYPAASQKH